MRESLDFMYDGIRSSDVGIINVSVSNGLYEEIFLPNAEIIETKVRGNPTPYFHELEYEPLSFSLRLLFNEGYDDEQIREVARLFHKDFYRPLVFEDNPNRIFYALLGFDSTISHNGLGQGYIDIDVRCDSPYTYSPVYTTNILDTSNETEITISNYGDLVCKPIVIIEKTSSNGSVEIDNLSNGQIMEFLNIDNGEQLKVDCEYEEIETDKVDTFRYNDHNETYLQLERGMNRLKFYGDFKIQFKYQFKTLQG